ncbi:MAG: bifunctional diguanylate cyclase/phosphodiesterase [Pseudomonadota bacterium]
MFESGMATVNRALNELGSDVIGALADAAVDQAIVLDRYDIVQWAGPGLCRRLMASPAALEGLHINALLARFGAPADPEAQAEALSGGEVGMLRFLDDEREETAFKAVVRSIPPQSEEGRGRVIVLMDVSSIMEQLSRAERAREAIEQRLNIDIDTGLPNERKMLERLLAELRVDDAVEGQDPVGILLVEVMDYRQIVDLYGADVGSEVLQELASTMSKALPEGQFVARLKEHEFGVLFPKVTSRQALVSTAEKLTQVLSIEVPTDLGDCRVSTLIAMAEMRPGQGSPDQILNNARIAMGWRDLPRRAGQIRVYEPEMRAALEARSRTYNELYAALDNDEIEPFFQPQIRLNDRAVVGFEVLVRWRHPEQGLVPPGLFLEIAEETGLLPAIDDVVMQKAMACLGQWHGAGHTDTRISLNCTGESLRDPAYVDKLLMEMDRHSLEPRHVAIEILETVLFGDAKDTARLTLEKLQKLGFYLEIDDFGTGQASISHLINLNADAVKLDRSLVRDITEDRPSRLVVEATVALSRNLGLATLAEGAENEDQMTLLTEIGCEYAQGFGIAKPMSFEDTSAWLTAHLAAMHAVTAKTA